MDLECKIESSPNLLLQLYKTLTIQNWFLTFLTYIVGDWFRFTLEGTLKNVSTFSFNENHEFILVGLM